MTLVVAPVAGSVTAAVAPPSTVVVTSVWVPVVGSAAVAVSASSVPPNLMVTVLVILPVQTIVPVPETAPSAVMVLFQSATRLEPSLKVISEWKVTL
ncbi:hypothetical protein D3C72_1661720 [compost metagenome]